MWAQALDAEVEAHDVIDLRKTCDPDHVYTGPRQLGFDPRGREGLLEESGEGAANGFERGHGRDPTRTLDSRKGLRYRDVVTYWKLERPSKRSGKKWKVRVPTSSGRGKTVAFGDATMSDYTIHKDKARRERYRTRHQNDRIDDPYAPGFWSWWSLWGESSDLATAHAAAVKRAKKILGVKKDPEGNEVARKNPSKAPLMGEAAQVIATYNVPPHLHAEFLRGLAVEWEKAPSTDLHTLGGIVFAHLGEDAHHYRRARRARARVSPRVQACFDALLSLVQEQYPSLSCTIEVDETAGERDGKACSRAFAFCEDHGEGGAFRIAIAGKLNDPDLADDSRVDGILRHELAHAVLLHGGDTEHTERDADEVAEALFGSPIFYDEDDVQTTDPSAPGARRPRPEYLDDEDGRTLDTPRTNPYPMGTMHQLHTVEDVASCLDDCAAQGDAKTPRMLASQLSQQAKQVAGAQSRMILTLAKAARHCANAIEARLGGEVDRAMASERLCERALADAQSPGRSSRGNPEWAKKLGSGLYKGTRYAGETARDLYVGAREAHAAHSAAEAAEEARAARAAAAVPAAEAPRMNPRRAGAALSAVFSRRLPEIGMLAVRPDPAGGYARASIEVTKAFADEWDHDMANQAYLARQVEDAVAPFRERANFYAVALKYRGREFSKLYPRGAGI